MSDKKDMLRQAKELFKNELFTNQMTYSDERIEALLIAIECIDKRIPQKPKRQEYSLCCSACGEDVQLEDFWPNYDGLRFCPECGNAVDWSGE